MDFFLYLFVLYVFVTAHCFIAGYRVFRQLRNIEDTPRGLAGSLAVGHGELQGHAWSIEKILEPVTQEEVAFYYIEGSHHKSGDIFRMIYPDEFLVVDHTGCAVVELHPGAEFIDLKESRIFFDELSAKDQKIIYQKLQWFSEAVKILDNELPLLLEIKYVPLKEPIYINGIAQPFTGSDTSLPIQEIKNELSHLNETAPTDDWAGPRRIFKNASYRKMIIANETEDFLKKKLSRRYYSYRIGGIALLSIFIFIIMNFIIIDLKGQVNWNEFLVISLVVGGPVLVILDIVVFSRKRRKKYLESIWDHHMKKKKKEAK